MNNNAMFQRYTHSFSVLRYISFNLANSAFFLPYTSNSGHCNIYIIVVLRKTLFVLISVSHNKCNSNIFCMRNFCSAKQKTVVQKMKFNLAWRAMFAQFPRAWAVPKRLYRSRCHLGCGLHLGSPRNRVSHWRHDHQRNHYFFEREVILFTF